MSRDMDTLPETPKKPPRASSTGLFTPPPTLHRSISPGILAPPLFHFADLPEAISFFPRQTIIPGPGSPTSPSPLVRTVVQDVETLGEAPGVKEEKVDGSLDMTMTAKDDDEIEYLGSKPAANNQVALRPHPQPPQLQDPLFLPYDGEYDLVNDIPPRPAPQPALMDIDDDFEFLGMGPGTPLNEVDEAEQGDGGVCRACGCTCRVSGQKLDEVEEEEPRRREGGSGSRVLENRILGNILGLLLGKESLLKRLQATNRQMQWEDVSAKVGARRADFDRVRHAARRMQERLPEMKRRGQF